MEEVNWWAATRDYDPNKPFGVIHQQIGTGQLEFVGYFQPEEDQDGFFVPLKMRLLTAVREWMQKGWITDSDIQQVFGAKTISL